MKTHLHNQYRYAAIIFLATLFFTLCAGAQTRFYLNLNTPSTITPAFNAGWHVTSGANRYIMSTAKDGSAITSKTTGNSGAIAIRRCLLDQFISEPLAAQTITGTFTGQVRFQQSSITSTVGQGWVYLRIINADGTIATEVGTATTTDLTTTLTNRTLISLPVGVLNITAGQRICVDLGWNYSVGTSTTRNCTISRGSAAATDLAADNTTTTANSPWFQFSQTLNFVAPTLANSARIDYGKTYVNITDGTIGGTIDPGDILEIRATLVVKQNSSNQHRAIDSVAFYDTLSPGAGLGLLPDSIALRTNEGKLYKWFSDINTDTDAGWYTTAGVGTDTAIQINMGIGASRTARGILRSSSRPSFYGNTCIIIATYRVVVNAGYGTKINFGGGAFRYRDSVNNSFYTINFPNDSLIVYASPGACPDAISATNVVGDEFNGTFGAPASSPGSQNRGTSANTNYIYNTFGANSPQDYYYGVANNTSATNAIVQTVPKGGSVASRVFNVWDITGDHTGAANITNNLSRGNLPCNAALPISPTNPCGYMLAINSAYRTDVAFDYNVTGACTETYYEISAWFKNICYRCGCDSTGTGSGSGGYIPTAAGDSSGVRPNIAMQVDGVDYYTTGALVYQGLGGTQTGSDTLNRWVRRSFVFKTLPNQSNFRVTFRNNAPGGGGNDWAIDDISIRTCYPNMIYSPSYNPAVCAGLTLTITDTVRSYYNVYIYYKWQRSTNGGATWVDLPGSSGVASTTWNGSSYEYANSYTLPPTATTAANNGDLYRMVVATNAANLSGTCNYSDASPVTLTVLNNCIDIDDDNDGIPDYVETNNPVALQDANSNGVPNWNDAAYPGRVDNNADGVDDRFDAGADADNDGRPNYMDTDFTFEGAFIDVNSDGVNDRYDKDLDGIINQYDLDSDNDAIPDVVESYGADTDGNGIIDGYVDDDNDGFSSNLDASVLTGVTGSGVGLGAQDLDTDGIPNYLDTDSDNDGIPDVVEVGGNYTTNSGIISGFVDVNADGISDNDVNAGALLLTGTAINIVTNGRAASFPNKNRDRDYRPNPYDLDSDGDGIADVIEAGLTDADLNGIADGTLGADGWSDVVDALAALNLRNTDAIGSDDYLDIDSDQDGIPDNIEGMSTLGYLLPTTTDADGDGLMSPYDNFVGYGGSGIFVYDHDGDGTPDYRDLDTDSDGAADLCEGNDWNLNGSCDEPLILTGLDTDGDGLDNLFDSLNSVVNVKGTSYMMGNGGSFTGDATPGTKATVQRTLVTQSDRDWRWAATVLPVQFLNFSGILRSENTELNWTIITAKEIDHFEVERSIDNITYSNAGVVNSVVELNTEQGFNFTDNISGINSAVIYYRLKAIGKNGAVKYSNVLVIRQSADAMKVTMMPNPAGSYVTISIQAEKNVQAQIALIDKTGRKVLTQSVKLGTGFNIVTLSLDKINQGVYALIIETNDEKTVKQLIVVK